MATVIGYWMPGIGLPQLDWNRINGSIYTPNVSPDLQFLSGGVFHYLEAATRLAANISINRRVTVRARRKHGRIGHDVLPK